MKSRNTLTERFPVGSVFREEVAIDQSLVARFAEFSGDMNPLHIDATAARSYGFAKPVAHGAILVALMSKLIGMQIPGPGAVWMNQEIKWSAPVFVGDRVYLTLTVSGVSEAARTLDIEATASNQKGQQVMTGDATVKVTEPFATEIRNEVEMKTALVTGGSGSIGCAIVSSLAEKGFAVGIGCRNGSDELDALVEEIRGDGGTAQIFSADLGQDGGAHDLATQAIENFGKLDVVVHAASPKLPSCPVAEMQVAALNPYLAVHLGAALELVQATVVGMTKRGHGRFVFLGTSALQSRPPIGWAPYLVAKHSLWGLVRSMAVELGPKGITTNMLSPSLTVTDLTADIPQRAKEVEAYRNPRRRLAEPTDTAEAAAFLASEGADYVNGQNVFVSGGGD